jgi:ribosomal protein S20
VGHVKNESDYIIKLENENMILKKRIRTLIGAIDIAIKIKDYEALKKHLTFVRKKVKEEWGE